MKLSLICIIVKGKQMCNRKMIHSAFYCLLLTTVLLASVSAGDSIDYTRYTVTGNQQAIGTVLNELYDNSTGDDMDDVLDEIRHLPQESRKGAYNQMMPQVSLSTPLVTAAAINQNTASLFDRMGNVRMAGLALNNRYEPSRFLAAADNSLAYVADEGGQWHPFYKAFGTWADREKDNDIAGYSYDLYGMAVGADTLVNENLLIGLSLGGSKANVNFSLPGTGTDIDSMFTSVYGSWFQDDMHVDVTLSYGHNWYDGERRVNFGGIDRTAKSEHEADAWSAAIELGKNLAADDATLLEPVVGLGYTAVHERGYQESDAGALSLHVNSNITESLTSKVGIRAAKEFMKEQTSYVPEVRAFWLHDFSDRIEQNASFVDGGSFTTRGRDPERDSLNLGTGLNVYLQKDCRLFASYDWQITSDFEAHSVQTGVQFSF